MRVQSNRCTNLLFRGGMCIPIVVTMAMPKNPHKNKKSHPVIDNLARDTKVSTKADIPGLHVKDFS